MEAFAEILREYEGKNIVTISFLQTFFTDSFSLTQRQIEIC